MAPTEYNILFRCPILFISSTACNSISQMRLIRSISVYKCFLQFSNEREGGGQREREEMRITFYRIEMNENDVGVYGIVCLPKHIGILC